MGNYISMQNGALEEDQMDNTQLLVVKCSTVVSAVGKVHSPKAPCVIAHLSVGGL